jgi:hypothetical protein
VFVPISKILVANRSEIAIRVFRAANELGLKTVAIWAEEDKYSLHRFKADESYQVGRGPHLDKDMGPIESYLSIEEVIRVAKASGADAIHPGYGLLSESPEFADACAAAGITFIGPKPETMRRLGNKVAARNLAIEVGVPVIPATDPLPDDMEAVKKLAAEVGYPVMLKASWGGGGHDRHADLDGQIARRYLVAKPAHGLGLGADEGDTGVGAGVGEFGAFGQQAVAGVDRVGAGQPCNADNFLDRQIAFYRPHVAGEMRPPPDLVAFIRLEAMQGVFVLFGPDRDRCQPQFVRGAKDADGDLGSIGDEDLGYWHGLTPDTGRGGEGVHE